MLERTKLINDLIEKNGYKSYLEIGTGGGINFKEVDCEHKIGVDPNNPATFQQTSDDFFATNQETFDIIFVDGLHIAKQVEKDMANSLKILKKGGVIVVHDCLPEIEERQQPVRITKNWQGDVWKAVVSMARKHRKMKLLEIETGIVLLWPGKKTYVIPEGELTWDWFVKNFKSMLCG